MITSKDTSEILIHYASTPMPKLAYKWWFLVLSYTNNSRMRKAHKYTLQNMRHSAGSPFCPKDYVFLNLRIYIYIWTNYPFIATKREQPHKTCQLAKHN